MRGSAATGRGQSTARPVHCHSGEAHTTPRWNWSFFFALFLVLLTALAVLTVATPVVAGNDSEPSGPVEGTVEIDVTAPDNEFDAGQDAALQLTISNDGEVTTGGTHPAEVRDRATQARSATVNVTDVGDAPITVRTGEQSVGTIESGESVVETFDIFVAEDADPGAYDVEVTTTYRDVTVTRYEEGVGDEVDIEEETEEAEETVDVTIVVADEARFDVVDVYHDVHVDDSGVLELAVEHTGTLDVTDVVVTAQTTDQDVFFGTGGASSERALDTWEAGATKTLRYQAGTTDQALTEAYPIDLAIEYVDPEGDGRTQSESVALTPHARQSYSVVGVDHTVVVGDDGLVHFSLRNDGPRNVSNATLSLSTNDPALAFEDAGGGSTTTETYVGDWAANETVTVVKRVGVSDDAAIRSYSIDATVAARDGAGNQLTSRTSEGGLEPHPRQVYTVDNQTHDVAIADGGVLTLEVTNRGPLNVTDASIQVSTNDGAITFGTAGVGDTVQFEDVAFETAGGGSPTSEAFVGDWAAGETVTVSFRAGATEDALERNYTVDLTVNARDENDDSLSQRERTVGFQPLPEQTFAIAPVDTDLRVGEDGTVVGSITNTGAVPARNVVVRYTSDLQDVFPRETQYAVGTLEPGEQRDFQFRLGIGQEVEAGPRLVEVETRYRNTRGEVRLTDAQDLLVEVHERRDVFAVDAVDATFEAGDDGLVEVELVNQREERLENIRAKVFTDDPLSSEDDEAFVAALDPGESTTVVFELRVDSGATAKTYPMSLDVRYDDERDQTQLTGTYRVPVTVTEDEGGGIPLGAIGLAGLVLGGVAVAFRTRLVDVGTRLRGTDRLR